MKQLLLIRHGQAEHNALFARNQYPEAQALQDAPLNAKGAKQARDLAFTLSNFLKTRFHLELIVTSPLTRTLQTTELVFSKHLKKCPVLVCPVVRETGDFPCDYGSPVSNLKKRFPSWDFSGIPEVFWTEGETVEEVVGRVEEFKEWALARPEDYIAVVSHGNFLKTLVRSGGPSKRFHNCEFVHVVLQEDGTLSMVS